MQSFLIVAKNRDLTSSHISNLLKENFVEPIDVNSSIYEKAMGIEDVRNIQKAILLKPFKGKTKAVIIDAYEGITQEAQNALLKILEEPPANTIIAITTTEKDLILPTIISRCKVVVLQEEKVQLLEHEIARFHDILDMLLDGKIGDKLKIAQDVTKEKGDASLWLEKMAIYMKEELEKNNDNLKYLNFLKEIQKTYKAIKSTNVGQRIAIENLLLSF